MGTLGEEQDGLSGLDGLDKVNTGIEKWGGAIAGGIDYNLKDYLNASKVGTFWGGALTKGMVGVTVVLEAGEVIAAATDDDPTTSASTQVVGAAVSVGVTPASGAAGALAGSMIAPGPGTLVGFLLGTVAGFFLSEEAESAVESWLDSGSTFGYGDGIYDPEGDVRQQLREEFPNVPIGMIDGLIEKGRLLVGKIIGNGVMPEWNPWDYITDLDLERLYSQNLARTDPDGWGPVVGGDWRSESNKPDRPGDVL